MSVVAKIGAPSSSAHTPPLVGVSLASRIPTPEHMLSAVAGEEITAGDALYMFGFDALTGQVVVKKSAKTNPVHWFAIEHGFTGGAISCVKNVRLGYAAAGTFASPGIPLYVDGTTPGALNTVPATGGNPAVAQSVTDSVIEVFGNIPAGV